MIVIRQISVLFLVVLVGVGVPFTAAQTALEFFVSPDGDNRNSGSADAPFGTIDRARDHVRSLNVDADVRVTLGDGTYYLNQTLRFGKEDSGRNGHYIWYQAAPDEKPIISGGFPIQSSWHRIVVGGKSIYVTRYLENPSASSLTLDQRRKHLQGEIRQLYVNGKRRFRARHPNRGELAYIKNWDVDHRRIEIDRSLLDRTKRKAFATPGQVEIHVKKHWMLSILKIKTLERNWLNAWLVPTDRAATIEFLDGARWKKPLEAFFLENALEFLDEPGEFYAKDGLLYYYPSDREDLREAEVVIPSGLETLVAIEGERDFKHPNSKYYSDSNFVRNIGFQRIRFAHTTWVNSLDAFKSLHVDYHKDETDRRHVISSAFRLQESRDIKIERNQFYNLGNTALALHRGGHSITFEGNHVREVGGNGIAVGLDVYPGTGFIWGYSYHAGRSGQPANAPSNRGRPVSPIVIANNYVSEVGRDFSCCIAIQSPLSSHLRIQNNHVSNCPHIGIALGWGWSVDMKRAESNEILLNHVHDVMQYHDDGAGIYLLGANPGTTIGENLIENIFVNPLTTKCGHFTVSGLYFDNGSKGMTAFNNVLRSFGPETRFIRLKQGSGEQVDFHHSYGVGDFAGAYTSVLEEAGNALPWALVAHWAFDNDHSRIATDRSGWNNVAESTHENRTLERQSGPNGKSLKLNGRNHLRVSTDSTFQFQHFAISALVRPDSQFSEMTAREISFVERHESDRATGFIMGANSHNQIVLQIGNGHSIHGLESEAPAADGWLHLVGTFDGTSLTLYRNGAVQSSRQIPRVAAKVIHANGPILLGRGFEGEIDDIRIYNRSMTRRQVKHLYERLTKSQPGTVENMQEQLSR